MSEIPTETVVESPEPVALPTPQVSAPSQAQPSEAPDADKLVSRLKEALLPELKQYVDRSAQSTKDRRIAGLEKRLEDLTSAKAALDAHGGDVSKAARELAIDDLLSRGEQPANLGKVGEDWETGVQKILGEAERAGVKIAPDDPEVLAVSRGTYPTWADAYAAVSRVIVKRAKGVPAGAVPTEVSGIPAATQDVDALANTVTQLIASNASTELIVAAKQKLLDAMK